MKKFIAPLLALVLLGAGCSEAVTSEEAKTETKPAVTSTTEKKPEITKTENTGEVRELVAAKTDDTWKTYTSKSLGFSFQWPTKGRYAPQWEVKHYASDNAELINGCVKGLSSDIATRSKVSVGDREFCLSRAVDGVDAHCVLSSVSYATTFGKTVAAIEFSKEICDESLPSGLTREQYIENYENTLDSIVGTFKINQ